MLDPLVLINVAQPHGALIFLCGQAACSTLDLKSHPELDRVMFYSVSVLFYAGDQGVILRGGGCVFPEELSCSRHSKWDSTSLLLLSFWHPSGGWPQLAVVGVNSPAVMFFLSFFFWSAASKLMSRSGLNSSSALDQLEKEKTIAGKVDKWNNQRNQARLHSSSPV